MLDSADVDEGYFTPVASTTLANIFRGSSSNDESVNASLKYRAPQPKKPEKSPRSEERVPDDPNATQCVFSCSVIAYEWMQGSHKCKGKVGFAVMRIINTGLCKIILYSSEKSTLSCTTISPQLKVILKGPMISLYDDHKKYWGLCFNDKIIDEVKKLLQKESVIINHYESRQSNDMLLKHKVEDIHVDDTADERDGSSTVEENESINNNEKASILNRIANVGHAILPTSASPIKNSLVRNTSETFQSTERLNVLPEASGSSSPQTSDKGSSRSIAVQASVNNIEHCNRVATDDITHLGVQPPITSMPFVNNQVFTYLNGRMVPVQTHAPVARNLKCGISAADIDDLIHKLTRLQGAVNTMEMCESDSTITIDRTEIKHYSDKISDLEEEVQKNQDIILNLQSLVKNEKEKSSDITKQQHTLKEQLEEMRQNVIIKEKEIKNMVVISEAHSLIASTVKKLMNDTFRSLASNFENEVTYTGSDVKGILAGVIKKCTVESLNTLLSNSDMANLSAEPAD